MSGSSSQVNFLPVHAAYDGIVSEIIVRNGDRVTAGQPLLRITTSSGTVTVAAERGGSVDRIKVAQGDDIRSGALLTVNKCN